MSVRDDLGILEEFSKALGCEIESWGKGRAGLITVRRVAGEDIATYFRLPSNSGPFIPKEDKGALRSIKSQRPRVRLRIITQFSPREEDIVRLAEEGIQVTTLLGYFNQVLDSNILSSTTIGNADRYLPASQYIEQRIVDEADRKAIDYIDEWLTRTRIGEKGEGDTSLLVVLAPAGHGKTCLAHHLARQLARKHLEDSSQPIPFLMPLHLHRHVREFREFVLDYLEANQIHGITSPAFAYLVNIGRVVPILDGFDELAEMGGPRVARKTLQSLLREFSEDSHTVLTSRQSLFRHRGDIDADEETADQFRIVELDSLNESERRSFFLKRGVHPSRIKIHESMVESVSYDEDVPGNPLMLKLVVDAARGRDITDLSAMSGARLLQYCIEKICDRELTRQPQTLSVEQQIELMSFLADVMFEENAYILESYDRWLELLAEDLLPAGLTEEQQADHMDKLMEMLRHHALLQFETSHAYMGRDGISFVHPIFRDYLIARAVSGAVIRNDIDSLRVLIRRALPESTKDYLADMANLAKMTGLVSSMPGIREFRTVLELLLRRCDRVSLDDIERRTETFAEGLGTVRSIVNQDLSGIEFRSLRLEAISFEGTNLSDARFQDCQFIDCNFSRSLLFSARFFGCVADKHSADSLCDVGIEDIAVVKKAEDANQTIEAKAPDDPVRMLVHRFLGRFVSERGMNKSSRQVITCLRGLGGAEIHFTRQEVIPEMRRAGVVDYLRAGRQEPALIFDSSWQADADAFLFDYEETDRLQRIIERLQEKTGRYPLY